MIWALFLTSMAVAGSDKGPDFRDARFYLTFRQPASDLPICDELDHLSETKFPAKPPAHCAAVLEYWNLLSDLDSANREGCHGVADFLQKELRDPALCENPHGRSSRLGKAMARFHEFEEPVDLVVPRLNASTPAEELETDLYYKTGTGELADKACFDVAKALFEFRYRHAYFAEAQWSDANRALRNACKPGGEEKELYLKEVGPGGKLAPWTPTHPEM
ncbi:MAG: hypothetical protein ACXVB9_21350 [Bdellovibrionota bacterium]